MTANIDGPFEITGNSYRLKAENRRVFPVGKEIMAVSVRTGSEEDTAQRIIDAGGLKHIDKDNLLECSADPVSMWLSAKGQKSGSIEIDLGKVNKVGFMALWNYNLYAQTKRGIKEADISVWTEKTGWKKLLESVKFEEADGTIDYDEPTFVKLDGVEAQKIRLDNVVNFGDAEYIGLSHLQFFEQIGPQAINPAPVDGSDIGGAEEVKLNWVCGLGAAAHNIYVGASSDKMEQVGTVNDFNNSMVKLAGLKKNSTYFWRVDEVKKEGLVTKGDTWNFSTGRLVGWWKFDDGVGSTIAADSSKCNPPANGLLIKGAKIIDDPCRGQVLHVGGKGDYVDCGNDPRLDLVDNLTISFWVKTESLIGNYDKIISKPYNSYGWSYPFAAYYVGFDSNRKFDGACALNDMFANVISKSAIDANRWYHCTFVLSKTSDGHRMEIYINGKIDAVFLNNGNSNNAAVRDLSRHLCIGQGQEASQGFEENMNGCVDDVRIYSHALNSEDVSKVYSGRELGLSEMPKLPKVIIEATVSEHKSSRNYISVLVIFLIAIIIVGFASQRKKA